MLSLAAFLPNELRATKGQNKSEVTSPLPPTLVLLICKRKKGFWCLRLLLFATCLVVCGLLFTTVMEVCPLVTGQVEHIYISTSLLFKSE